MSKQVILDWKESTGSSNAYVVWIDWPWYYDGQTIRFVANHTNTWAATLSVSWKPAIAIKKNNDAALVAWDIEAGQILLVSYNETDNVFELLSETASKATSSDLALSFYDVTVALWETTGTATVVVWSKVLGIFPVSNQDQLIDSVLITDTTLTVTLTAAATADNVFKVSAIV